MKQTLIFSMVQAVEAEEEAGTEGWPVVRTMVSTQEGAVDRSGTLFLQTGIPVPTLSFCHCMMFRLGCVTSQAFNFLKKFYFTCPSNNTVQIRDNLMGVFKK